MRGAGLRGRLVNPKQANDNLLMVMPMMLLYQKRRLQFCVEPEESESGAGDEPFLRVCD